MATIKSVIRKDKVNSNVVQRIEDILVDLKREKIEPEAGTVKDIYDKIFNDKSNNEFFSVYADFIQRIKDQRILSDATIKHYVTTRNHLLDYSKEKKIKITFKSFDKKFYGKYMEYLRAPIKFNGKKVRIGGGKGMVNNTRGTQIKNLKSFLNYCLEDGHNVNVDFKKFKVLKEKKPVIYLTQFEFEIFRTFDFSNNKRLERVRDLFIIASRTGLRVSDLSRLNKQHFVGDRILIRAHKNQKDLRIKITPFVHEILEKYNYELPKISDQKYNDYIKEAGKNAGIDHPVELVTGSDKKYSLTPKYELMSSHTAVKTFITHCGEKGISAKVVAEITGKTVQVILDHYYGTNNDTIDREMEKAFGNDQPLMQVG